MSQLGRGRGVYHYPGAQIDAGTLKAQTNTPMYPYPSDCEGNYGCIENCLFNFYSTKLFPR